MILQLNPAILVETPLGRGVSTSIAGFICMILQLNPAILVETPLPKGVSTSIAGFICMILQLNPAILVETPLGRGEAIFLIDYGMHQNSCWVVALLKDGIIKHFDCNDVIMATNYTYGLNLAKNSNDIQERRKETKHPE